MIEQIGRHINLSIEVLKEFLKLCSYTFWFAISPPYRVKDITKHLVFVANESALIIFICVSFAAGVTIVEAAYHMNLVVQNHSMVPGFAAMLILRELAAVVSCLLLGSRVGAGWAAEVASMKVTEQIDALKMLGIDPIRFLVSPRFVACLIGGVCLVTLSNVICLGVAMLISTVSLDFTLGSFISAARSFVGLKDLAFSAIKGLCFGGVIPLIACFFGFRCKAGAEGVGLATTNAVVAISVAIIMIDFILTWIFSNFY